MFLPSEAVYAELHANLPQVVQDAFRRRVWIVSPTTLMATLNTVRAVLKDAKISEQAGLLQAEVGRLLDDVRRLDDRVGKLQTHFRQAGE
jgi:DNA recombination protein RmuC